MKLTNPLNIFLKQNDPNWFDVIRPTKLPAFPNQFAPNGKVFYGVRRSRLRVKSTTPTKYGELKTSECVPRENFLDGFKSDDFRIQFSFKYNFSKTFTY